MAKFSFIRCWKSESESGWFPMKQSDLIQCCKVSLVLFLPFTSAPLPIHPPFRLRWRRRNFQKSTENTIPKHTQLAFFSQLKPPSVSKQEEKSFFLSSRVLFCVLDENNEKIHSSPIRKMARTQAQMEKTAPHKTFSTPQSLEIARKCEALSEKGIFEQIFSTQ